MPELRKYPRLQLPVGVSLAWQSANQKLVSRLGNLCLGGLFICTLNPLTPGTPIQLLMETPAGEIRARAEVRSTRARIGMGVKFVAMQPEDRARLGRWLNLLSV